jgi:hypothetical protein
MNFDGETMTKFALAATLATLVSGSVFADVPKDLESVVDYQKQNKIKIVTALQQRAASLRKSGKKDEAKQVTDLANDVRQDKALWFPDYGAVFGMPGRLSVDSVIEREEHGFRISTSIPRSEPAVGVNVHTGAAVHRPWMGSTLIYHPEKVSVVTQQNLAAGQEIIVRSTNDGLEQIPSSQIEEAAKLLKQRK